jgi:hypothetical protein
LTVWPATVSVATRLRGFTDDTKKLTVPLLTRVAGVVIEIQ